jgi:hypothetical protein
MKLDTVRSTAAHAYCSIPCAQCGDALIAPQWSEHVSARCVRHVWSCESCGYQFESLVYLHASSGISLGERGSFTFIYVDPTSARQAFGPA